MIRLIVLLIMFSMTALAGLVPKPMFADPNYHGSCDPEVVWNDHAKEWWVFYTARRATLEKATYVGTPIGVVASKNLVDWTFKGYCSFDGEPGRPDMPVTFWAPGIIRDGDTCHMFVTYKDNAVAPWGGQGVIRHYVAPVSDLLNGWKLAGVPNFNQPDPIDASLIKVKDGFRAYYRVGKGGGIQWATSTDLETWENQGKCPGAVNAPERGFGYQEAPYVFKFRNWFWMLTDPHKGLAVFRSKDGIAWTQQERILEKPGTGAQDATLARHPSVAVINGRAFLFYHVEPNRPYPTPKAEDRTPEQKISFLQIAELQVKDGVLTCDRDAAVVSPVENLEVAPVAGRWSAQQAHAWHERQPWLVGANFVPSSAINQLEMWQADTFDPEAIDRELGWAAAIGMNTMRVFLHDICWREDKEGFFERIDHYLEIADRHGIGTMFVLFDGVWYPLPKAGKQPEPMPRTHNSGWVQSPGKAILADPAKQDALKGYVQDVIRRYKDDPRVLIWDLFNEPDNGNGGKWGGSAAEELPAPLKRYRATELLEKSFAWAREVAPSQPLTAGVWGNPKWFKEPSRIDLVSLRNSDILSFHTYHNPNDAMPVIGQIAAQERPALCTEYMARGTQSTFEGLLPQFKQHKIGAYNWGLVDGKSQTIYPWDSWKKTYTAEPEPWFHDVFRKDGTPYRQSEVDFIKHLTSEK
ncbi:hypothetical protein PDESU_01849 [Pontiella desulfatans]|uniref:Uncharacterized protein n=1 Tax=Pontiella desulfatans TaxID=2750659 RepID=A0A6C2U099_PONDE|nr:cellulase family glycosylhydrolase [Pontiella desulfatans]VGO13293.1 hypothetical protein PDESU_01849 [Pontiella desulfatans]